MKSPFDKADPSITLNICQNHSDDSLQALENDRRTDNIENAGTSCQVQTN